jgi:hypothetical protein
VKTEQLVSLVFRLSSPVFASVFDAEETIALL